jgi:hypothetical protein
MWKMAPVMDLPDVMSLQEQRKAVLGTRIEATECVDMDLRQNRKYVSLKNTSRMRPSLVLVVLQKR